MRLCIADPPYLGRSAYYSGDGRPKYARLGRVNPADAHADAHLWDEPETHRALVRRLDTEYDGWALALSRDSLSVYLGEVPDVRVCVWHNPAAWPPGGRIHATWEPVLVRVPAERRAAPRIGDRKPMAAMSPRERATVSSLMPKDVLTAVPPRDAGFAGAKPRAWTRWVLDMLGYDAETDTVDDLFPGSGAVAAEVAQTVLDLGAGEAS